MTIIGHLLRKDVRVLRLLLVFWLLIVIVRWLLVSLGTDTPFESRGVEAMARVLTSFTPLVYTMLWWLIIPFVIQQEPLVGSDAFWVTRPIDPKKLLAAKALFLILFLVIPPLVAELSVMTLNGVTVRHLALAVPEILLWQLFWIPLVMVLAVLTSNFARFALATGMVIAGLVLLVSVAFLLTYSTTEAYLVDLDGPPEPTPSFGAAPLVVWFGIFIGIIVIAIGHQYVTRRTARSVFLALGAACFGYLSPAYWPWSMSSAAERELPLALRHEDVRLVMNPTVTVLSERFGELHRRKEMSYSVAAQIDIVGLPPEDVANFAWSGYTLRFQDGTVRHGSSSGTMTAPSDSEPTAWGRQLGALRAAARVTKLLNRGESDSGGWPVVMRLKESDLRRYEGRPGRYQADVHIRLNRYEVMASLPLRIGSRYDEGSRHVTITDVVELSGIRTVILKESFVNLLFDPQQFTTFRYLLRHRDTGEALETSSMPVSSRGSLLGSLFPDVSVEADRGFNRFVKRHVALPFDMRQYNQQPQRMLDRDWYANTELLLVKSVHSGTLKRTITTEGFRIPPAATEN